MNFKRYHVSKNLLSEKYENRSINGVGAFTIDSNYDLWIGEVVAGQTYAISNMNYVYGFFTAKPLPNTGATYDGSRGYETSGAAVVTVPSGCTWIAVRVLHNADNAMCNAGSQPLPYEPYSSEVWHDIPHYIHKTATDTLTLPAVLYPTGTTATVGLKGNMEQSSQPSHDNPIMPQGTGERTGNLLPEFYATSGEISGNSYTITKNSIETHNDGSVLGSYFVLTEFKRGSNYANYILIDEKHSFRIPAGTYTFSANEKTPSLYNGLCLIVGQLGKSVSGATSGAEHIYVGQTFTINEDSYVCPILEIRSDSLVDEYILTNPMLNRGSTPLPYEPYGYFIEIEVS